jgi:hypothetical protein
MLLISKDLVLIGWVSGFVDGEGCFSVSFNRAAKLARGIEVRPSFSISQNERSRASIDAFEKYFEGGAVRFSRSDRTYKYETRSLDHIRSNVIPFFKQYPFKTNKQKDFMIFAEICDLMAQSQHLNVKGLTHIIQQAYLMNEAGARKYTQAQLISFIEP